MPAFPLHELLAGILFLGIPLFGMVAGMLVTHMFIPRYALLGLTGVDLFMPALTYVFGISHLGGRRGIVSWFRLHPDGKGPDAASVLVRRITTEVVHESGHAMGLVHCVVPDCAMHRSLWPEGVDLKRPDYCPACLATLNASL